MQRSNVALDFLVNSRLRRGDLDLLSSALHYYEDSAATALALVAKTPFRNNGYSKLPAPIALHRRLEDAIRARKSCRQFSGDPIAANIIATLLWAGVGTRSTATANLSSGDELNIRLRTTPSGGGLQPIQLWFIALKCTGVDQGIFAYDEPSHALARIHGMDRVEKLTSAFAVPEETLSVSRAAGLFCLVGKPWRSMRKYGPRGMRLMFMEAGYISEAIHLAASSLGIGTVDCSAVFDDEANESLGLDGVHTTLVHMIVAGMPG